MEEIYDLLFTFVIILVVVTPIAYLFARSHNKKMLPPKVESYTPVKVEVNGHEMVKLDAKLKGIFYFNENMVIAEVKGKRTEMRFADIEKCFLQASTGVAVAFGAIGTAMTQARTLILKHGKTTVTIPPVASYEYYYLIHCLATNPDFSSRFARLMPYFNKTKGKVFA